MTIAEYVLKAIEGKGLPNVLQVITKNAAKLHCNHKRDRKGT